MNFKNFHGLVGLFDRSSSQEKPKEPLKKEIEEEGQKWEKPEQGNIVLPMPERDKRIADLKVATIMKIKGSVKKMIEFQDEIVKRFEYLKNKYPDYQNRTIMHALMGSGLHVSHTNVNEDDFPGEDSVEKFVNDLVEKYSK